MRLIAPNTLLHERYRTLRLVGSGAMGAVYEAEDQRLGHRVALKHNDPANTLPPDAFRREARLLAHLRHPALPSVSDYFSEGEDQFLVMPFIPGADLGAILRQRGQPFALADVLRWADQLLDALIYLHGQRPPIIHRDIKPQNLKLDERGEIMLLDFGVAKGSPPLEAHPETAGSIHAFTRQYAPLEQIQGSGTDARSDLYALAATLYHLLTARPPADALTRALAAISQQPDPLAPPQTYNQTLPAAIGEALMAALALSPANRPASAAKLRTTLSEAAAELRLKPPARAYIASKPRSADRQADLDIVAAPEPPARQTSQERDPVLVEDAPPGEPLAASSLTSLKTEPAPALAQRPAEPETTPPARAEGAAQDPQARPETRSPAARRRRLLLALLMLAALLVSLWLAVVDPRALFSNIAPTPTSTPMEIATAPPPTLSPIVIAATPTAEAIPLATTVPGPFDPPPTKAGGAELATQPVPTVPRPSILPTSTPEGPSDP